MLGFPNCVDDRLASLRVQLLVWLFWNDLFTPGCILTTVLWMHFVIFFVTQKWCLIYLIFLVPYRYQSNVWGPPKSSRRLDRYVEKQFLFRDNCLYLNCSHFLASAQLFLDCGVFSLEIVHACFPKVVLITFLMQSLLYSDVPFLQITCFCNY